LFSSPWNYTDEGPWLLSTFYGEFASYGRGGYIAKLKEKNQSLAEYIKFLQPAQWIDLYTRYIFKSAASLFNAQKS